MKFELTDEQKNVTRTFIKFLADPKEKYMFIQGAAGVGKTTMVKHMLESIKKKYKLLKTLLCENPEKQDFQIVLSATTNKAAATLSEIVGDHDVRTVHSVLGLSIRKDFRTGQEYLTKNNRWAPLLNTILIIDEGSMLDSVTMTFLAESLGPTSKAVIIGDIYQLAPVNENRTTMETMLHKYPTAVLDKVLRHSGPILEAATAFREVVKTGRFQDILLSDKVIYVDGPEFHEEVKAAFLHPDYNPDKAKILAWSNRRVQAYNQHMRKLKNQPELLQKGEYVVTNNPIIEKGSIIPTDSLVFISDLDETEEELWGVMGRWATLDYKVRAFLPNDYKDAKRLLRAIKKEAQAASGRDQERQRRQLWSKYFEIKDTWLDLRPSYASTVHKAQGNTFDEVFIDLWDIGSCNLPMDVARMLYVAISRGRNRIILTGELPLKYRGALAAA